MRYQFVEEHRNDYPVTLLCRVMQVARSGYYAWRNEPLSLRKVADMVLLQHIRDIFEEGRQSYGSARIQGILADQGISCGRERVTRLMQAAGLKPKTRRPFRVITTDSKHQLPVAANQLDRDFTADGPNQKWVTDITYVATAEGWLYLAVVLDLYSRQIVGWAMSDSLQRQLVIDALQMAIVARRPAPGLLHHSDRSSQYASHDYQALLTRAQMVSSMSRKGDCYDNAVVQSFFGTLKTELIYQRQYATRAEARADIFEYIEVFYNRIRCHSALGYKSPVRFEALSLVA